MHKSYKYCKSLTAYSRRESYAVNVGDIPLGGTNPIRIQSMTTVNTMDTEGTVQQSIRMIDAGCEYVRITAPSINEARNLEKIKNRLLELGYNAPIIADIHFTPNAAEMAARIVEKVRINPGNYADKKKFEQIRYTSSAYEAELDRISEKFTPLIMICKEYGTAMRIGTNHGSLSDRIMSRYGDTPLGMVESALEFVRICEDLNYHDIVLSMKASNPKIMVQAYRLLVNRLNEESLKPYPLHLGVTEAGEAEDGRIKSSVGIGTLLEDGLGDTIRVSLTEEPEMEIPVAKDLVDRYHNRIPHETIPEVIEAPLNAFEYSKRKSKAVLNIGGNQVPRVIADYSNRSINNYDDLEPIGYKYSQKPDKFIMKENGADFVFTGDTPASFLLPSGLKEILNYPAWQAQKDKRNKFPLLSRSEFENRADNHQSLNFIKISYKHLDDTFLNTIKEDQSVVLVVESFNKHAFAEIRRMFIELNLKKIESPVIIQRSYSGVSNEELLLFASTDIGGLLLDGYGEGVFLQYFDSQKDLLLTVNTKLCNDTVFGILQATRTRITKTEYISCPSCGRTLFDLQKTTAMIRRRTDHLKGLKIGIMGCIVNGPGEMADADYGYVGSGKGKITLYRNKEVVKRGVPSEMAVDELVNLIKNDGNWIETGAVH